MPLPRVWVDRIHARLLVRYGSAWINKWQGIDDEVLKADWANELAGVSMESISYALENLPTDQPPNVSQFRRLCINRPEKAPLMLGRPKPTEEEKQRVRDILHKAKEAITK